MTKINDKLKDELKESVDKLALLTEHNGQLRQQLKTNEQLLKSAQTNIELLQVEVTNAKVSGFDSMVIATKTTNSIKTQLEKTIAENKHLQGVIVESAQACGLPANDKLLEKSFLASQIAKLISTSKPGAQK